MQAKSKRKVGPNDLPESLQLEICLYLSIGDLHQWRQVSQYFRKMVTTLMRSSLLTRSFWKCVDNDWQRKSVDDDGGHLKVTMSSLLKELLEQTDGLVVGSTVTRFCGGDSYKSRDLDLIVAGTVRNFDIFRKWFLSWAHRERVQWKPWLLKKYISTLYIREGAAPIGLTGDTKDPIFNYELKPVAYRPLDIEGVSFAERCEAFKSWSSPPLRSDDNYILPPDHFLPHSISHGIKGSGSYDKHVRSCYFAIHLVSSSTAHLCRCSNLSDEDGATPIHCPADHRSLDVIFVPQQDLGPTIASASDLLYQWICREFDFDICASAISTKRLFCMVPGAFLRRETIFRMNQYCVRVPKGSRFQHSDTPDIVEATFSDVPRYDHFCNCAQIVPSRIAKYQHRGFTIVAG